jgi:hypothetical protein
MSICRKKEGIYGSPIIHLLPSGAFLIQNGGDGCNFQFLSTLDNLALKWKLIAAAFFQTRDSLFLCVYAFNLEMRIPIFSSLLQPYLTWTSALSCFFISDSWSSWPFFVLSIDGRRRMKCNKDIIYRSTTCRRTTFSFMVVSNAHFLTKKMKALGVREDGWSI